MMRKLIVCSLATIVGTVVLSWWTAEYACQHPESWVGKAVLSAHCLAMNGPYYAVKCEGTAECSEPSCCPCCPPDAPCCPACCEDGACKTKPCSTETSATSESAAVPILSRIVIPEPESPSARVGDVVILGGCVRQNGIVLHESLLDPEARCKDWAYKTTPCCTEVTAPIVSRIHAPEPDTSQDDREKVVLMDNETIQFIPPVIKIPPELLEDSPVLCRGGQESTTTSRDETTPAPRRMPYAEEFDAPGGISLFGRWFGWTKPTTPPVDDCEEQELLFRFPPDCREDPNYHEQYPGCPFTGPRPMKSPTNPAPPPLPKKLSGEDFNNLPRPLPVGPPQEAFDDTIGVQPQRGE
jgi:hypothetical protein